MNTREITTLQFGHYPNFIGSHWWNIQETGFDYSGTESEINHDVLYREGITQKGQVTFTPRLLLFDLKGSLKTLPKQGDLYEPISEPTTSTVAWPENAVEVTLTEEIPLKNDLHKALENPEINLDTLPPSTIKNQVKVWSDFLYTRFHPRTVNVINEYVHESETKVFDVFSLGTDLWKNSYVCEEFSDKIRNYIEECDSPQGFHVLLDSTNSFGGLAAACVEELKDDYNKSIFAFATIPSYYNDYNITSAEEREKSTMNDSLRLINLAFCLDALSENCSLTVPLCTGEKGWRQPGVDRNFKHVKYNSKSFYETSAVLASALETLTTPYRKKSIKFSLADFCADLNRHGCKIAAASLGLPFNLNKEQDLIDCLDNWEGPLWQSITPNCSISTDKTMQVVTLRGIPEFRLKQPPNKAERQRQMPAYRCETVQEMLHFYLSCTSYATASHISTVTKGISVKSPYPDIFDEFVDIDGNISTAARKTNQNIKSVPVIAGCHSGSGIGNMLEALHRETSRVKIARLSQFQKAGLETDEYDECLHRLLDLKECYEETYYL